ncbi:MAG: hypothetical protein ACR2JC_00980 [Chloroflexota bacterium]|nr:MAG: hypothetical protein DLM70_16485 [Chloroflexota bacterium]
MSESDLLERVDAEERRDATVDEIANGVYRLVRARLDRREVPPDDAMDLLERLCVTLERRGDDEGIKAVATVLACFEGYCAPSSAL